MMRTQLNIVRANIIRPLLVAALAVAMAFTFSCSSDDGGDNNGGGTGVPFDENSQVYNGDGSLFTGSGTIEVVKGSSCSDNSCKWAAGSVTNGIVNLQLPSTIPSEYIKDFSWESEGCSGYEGIKVFQPSLFRLTNSDGNSQLAIGYKDDEITQGVEYWYLSKAGKITCKNEKSHRTMTINATVGWNKIYRVTKHDVNQTQEYNTNNILVKEAKWMISPLNF